MPTDQYELLNSNPVQTAEEIARANLKKAKRAEEAKAAQEQAAKEREAEIKQKQEGLRIQAQKEADERAKDPKYQGRLNKPKTNWVTIEGKRVPLQKAIEDIPRQYEEADRKKAEQDAADQRIHSSPLMAKALRRARTEHLMEKEGMNPQDAEALARKEQLERRLAFEHGQKSMDAMPDSFAKEARMFGVEMGGALLAPVMRMTGNDHAADQYEASKAGMQSGMDEHRELFYPYPETQAAFSGAVQSLGQMAPGAIAGAMGQPGVGMAIMAGQFGSQEYSRALYEGAEAGLSGADLNQYATLQGGIEAAVMPVFSAIPGLGGLEARLLRQTLARSVAQNPTIRKALTQGAKKLTFETASELLEEITTEALHGFVDQKKLGKDVDFWKITKDTSLQTLITMGLVNLGSAAGKLFEKRQQAQKPPQAPDVNLEEPTPPPQDPAQAQAQAAADISRFPDLMDLAQNNPEKLPELAAEAQRRLGQQEQPQAPAGPQESATPAQSQKPDYAQVFGKEIAEFIAKPESMQKYEAAVAAGMKAIDNTNRKGRAFLAKFLKEKGQQLWQQQGTQTPSTSTPDPASQMEAQPETVSDGDSEVEAIRLELMKGTGHEEGSIQGQEGQQQEGHQEGKPQVQQEVLTPDQAATPDTTQQTADDGEAKKVFQKAYEDAFKQWQKYSPDQAGHTQYAEILSAMHDSHPDWADELHDSKTSPVVAPGPSPEQPTPSTAVPVSSEPKQEPAQEKPFELNDEQKDFVVNLVQNSQPGFAEKLLRDKVTRAKEMMAQKGTTEKERATLEKNIRVWNAQIDHIGKVPAPPSEAASDKPVGWRREAGEDRGSYHTRLKQQGWKKSPKPSVTFLDSPDRVRDLSIQQLKDKPFKAGDKVTLHTGFSGDDMQIDAEIVEDSKPGESHVKVRTKEGRVHSSSAYYVTPDAVEAPAEPQKPASAPEGTAKPPKGSIGFNAQGEAIFESVTGLRSVNGEFEQASKLKQTKNGTKVVLARPREDRFKTVEELNAGKPSGFESLPYQSRAKFEKAYSTKDVKWLQEMVDPSNVNLRAEFERRSGITLPKTQKDTKAALEQWAGVDAKAEEPDSGTEPQKPSIEQLTEAATAKPIGRGGNAVVYDIADTDFVLRVPNAVKTIDDSFTAVKDIVPGLSVGQAVFTNKDGVSVLRKQKGVPAGLALPSKDTKADVLEYAEKVKLAASMPQSAFDDFAETLRKLNESDQMFDPSKSNNVLIDKDGGRFNVVDVNPKSGSKYRSGLDDMLVPLMGNTFAYKYLDALKSGIATEDLKGPWAEIYRKAKLAATKNGLDTKHGSSGEYSRQLAGIGTEPQKPEAPAAETQEPQAEAASTPEVKKPDEWVISRESTDKELKAAKSKHKREIALIAKNGRTLKLAYDGDTWKIAEREGRYDKIWASEIPELSKAKDVARRIYRNEFRQDSDLVFTRTPKANYAMTNGELGKAIAKLPDKNAAALIATVRDLNLASNMHMLFRVSDKERDAILKGVDREILFTNTPYKMAETMLEDAQRDLPKMLSSEVVAYRGGDYHHPTVVIQSSDGKLHTFDQSYFDTVMKRFPSAQLKMDGDAKLVLEEGGKAVALLLGYQGQKYDTQLDLLQKGVSKYPFKEAFPIPEKFSNEVVPSIKAKLEANLQPEDPRDGDGWAPVTPFEVQVTLEGKPPWNMEVTGYKAELKEVQLFHPARREYYFMRLADLKEPGETKPEGKRHPSAVMRYPKKIQDPYNYLYPDKPREFDAPPIYLTGVSNDATREAAKTMPNLGVVVQPNTAQYVGHLADYNFIGVDNGAFTSKKDAEFREDKFYSMLDEIREAGFADKVIYAVAPDVVGDWEATLKKSAPHFDRIRDAGFPVAVALQNGVTVETVPWDKVDILFVGGDDNFKEGSKDGGEELMPIVREAKRRGVPMHFGRVNSARRLEIVHYGLGANSVDGTFVKYGNPDKHTNDILKWLAPWGQFPQKLSAEEMRAQTWWDKTLGRDDRMELLKKVGAVLPADVEWRDIAQRVQKDLLQHVPADFNPDNASPAESLDILGAAGDLWDQLDAEESSAKTAKAPAKEKKPRKPREPKAVGAGEPKVRTKRPAEKTAEAVADAEAEMKAAAERLMDALKQRKILSLIPGAPPVLDKEALVAAVSFARTVVKFGVVKFADYVAKFVDAVSSPQMAQKISDYLEAAWTVAGNKLPDLELDPAGKVADVLAAMEAKKAAAASQDQNAGESQSPAAQSQSPAAKLAVTLAEELKAGRPVEAKRLWELADAAYGGTRAEGKYGPSEAYDALETAINLTMLDQRKYGQKVPVAQLPAQAALKAIQDLQSSVASQTNRSGEKDAMQQFSTPPSYGFVIAQIANINAQDVVLEPSGGTGDIVVQALNQRAKVHANELSKKRAEMLKVIQNAAGDRLTISTEDALQLGNIMGPKLRPSVVLMNPPFSREGERMGDLKMPGNDRKHIDAALSTMVDGGRLVAIIGAGLHGPSKGFTQWLDDISKKHNVRANIEVAREVYKGYGTNFPTRVIVIDKGTPTPPGGTLTGKADSLSDLLTMTEGIRNDRNRGTIQPVAPGLDVPGTSGVDEAGLRPLGSGDNATAAAGSGRKAGKSPRKTSTAKGNATGNGTPNGGNGTGTGTGPDVSTSGDQRTGSGEPSGDASDDAPAGSAEGSAGDDADQGRPVEKRTEIDENVLFEPYRPVIVPFKNAKPHPTSSVESAAMAAVEYPKVTEVPNIGKDIINSGTLSDVQLEFIALAQHAHNNILPNGERTGILFGDGTGMGKGRGIPGVILHNWNEGRKRAVWMSKNTKLYVDAQNEWAGFGMNPDQIINLTDTSVDDPLDITEGILFATYDTLADGGASGKMRIEQVKEWLGKDFDGVIAFDEAHMMGSDSADRASVARDLQDSYPLARVVYASATAATEVDQLKFASRLGLWGTSTPFASALEFAQKIGAAGVAAMESVALSLKAMGRYVSRSISFNDGTPNGTVGYRRLQHTLETHQVEMYDRLSEAWQKVIQAFEASLEATEATSHARSRARGQFWGAHQRFFNNLVTSLQMPSVITSMEKDLAEGKSVVIQLTQTGAAMTDRALRSRGTESLDDFSVDPFQTLVELVRTQFPTQAYEDYVKADGTVGKRPVRDANGNPVKDAQAVAEQQALLQDLEDMEGMMPDTPLDMIINHFGFENVGEVTSRAQRIVWEEQPDGSKKRVIQKRTGEVSNQADIDAFQQGKKRILIFSQAGGTGASYHADKRVKNQQKRIHYLVQPGWVAADAIQGLGRTHRTNQKWAPEYVLVQTDIPGQKRFISTIARRLTQLGALTRGQRTASGGGVFDAADNLESTEAEMALVKFFRSLVEDNAVMSIDEFEQQTGLALRSPMTGNLKSDNALPGITSFMNRLLSMSVANQNKVFDKFDTILKEIIEARRISGELDQGVETLKGKDIKKTKEQVVYTHESGAKTSYVQLSMEVPVRGTPFGDIEKSIAADSFQGFYKRVSDGRIYAVNSSFPKTNAKTGRVVEMIRMVAPTGEPRREEDFILYGNKYEEVSNADAELMWDEQYAKRQRTKTEKVDMITGAVLPVWDRLPQLTPKLSRAMTTDGNIVLGVVIPPSKVPETLEKLGAESNSEDNSETLKVLLDGDGEVQLTNGWKLQRVRFQHENRIELEGPYSMHITSLQQQGVIIERAGFKTRFFIPVGENAKAVFDRVTRNNPVLKVTMFGGSPAATPEQAAPAEPMTELDRKKAELKEIQEENQKHIDTIKEEFDDFRNTAGSGLPVSGEMMQAIAGLMVNKIREGMKRFEIFIAEMRADLNDEIVQELEEPLMRVWNGPLSKKYKLEPATPADFQAGMKRTKGQTSMEQVRERAGIQSDTGRIYSNQNAVTDYDRTLLDMGRRIPLVGPSNAENIERANLYSQTEQGRARVDELIAEFIQAPRAATPFENALLLRRQAELGNRIAAAQSAMIAARERGDDVAEAVNNTIVETTEAERSRLVEALSTTLSYAAGANLQARKMLVDQDYSLPKVLVEFERAYGRRPEVGSEEYERLKKQVQELEAANAELEKHLQQVNEKAQSLETQLEEQFQQAIRDAQAPQPTVRERLQASAREQVDRAWKKLGALRGKAYSLETASAEAMGVLVELAIGYSRLGVSKFADFFARMKERMGSEADQFRDDLEAAWESTKAKAVLRDQDEIMSRLNPDDPESVTRVSRALLRFVIRRDGIKATGDGRTEAVNAVYDIMVTAIPDITEEEVATAISGIGRYTELSQDEAEIISRDIQSQLLILKQTEYWDRKEAPPFTGRVPDPESVEQRNLRRLRDEAKKRSGVSNTSTGQNRSALDAAKRAAQNRIDDLNEAIDSRTPIHRTKKVLKTDAELEALRKRRDELKDQYDEIFGKPGLSDEQRISRAEKLLERQIANIKKDIAEKKLYHDPKTGKPVDSEKARALRADLAKQQAILEELRVSTGAKEERENAQYKRMLLELDAKLAKKIATKDFAVKPKKERELDDQTLKLMRNLDIKRKVIDDERKKQKWDQMHIVHKTFMKGPMAVLHTLRKLKTTLDQSLIGRQGYLLGIIHPKIYGKSVKAAFAATPLKSMTIFPTEEDLFNVVAQLDADDKWVRLEKIGKLAVTGVHGGVNREEDNQWAPEILNRIWGIGGSERAGSAFINTQRRLVFRHLVERLSRNLGGSRRITAAELRVIANFVNVSSGRGSLGKYANSLEAMSAVFFSPRWWMSRLAVLTGQPIWHDSRWFGGEGATTEVRKMVAKEWGKQMAAQATVIAIAYAALKAAFGAPGEDEDWEFYVHPTSPNFGKFRVSKTVIDATAGLGQHVALFSRLMTGTQEDRYETKEVDKVDLLGRFVRGKLAPAPAMFLDYLAGESIDGKEFGSAGYMWDQVLPLAAADILETREAEGGVLATVFSTLSFFGISAQAHEARVRDRKDAIHTIRTLKNQGKPEEARKAMMDHLAKSAKAEATAKMRTAEESEKSELRNIIDGDPEALARAVVKEQGDIAIKAVGILSSESKEKKSADDDASIATARELLKDVAPTFDDANKLLIEGYKQRYGGVSELVNGKWKTKEGLKNAQYRLRALYKK